jgi:hypothetical protein
MDLLEFGQGQLALMDPMASTVTTSRLWKNAI